LQLSASTIILESSLALIMLPTIKLHRQVGCVAIKIQNIRADRMLPTEFESEFATSQQKPEETLRVRLMQPEGSGENEHFVGEFRFGH